MDKKLLKKLYQLEQAPVFFEFHNAVQRDVVLSQIVMTDESQRDQLTESAKSLAESINLKMLPLYLKTNLEVTSKWAGLYPVKYNDTADEGQSFWKWAYSFLQEHTEVERVALINDSSVRLNKNPFPKVNDDYIYVADELNEIQKLSLGDMPLTEVREFIESNQYLQLLNPAVIVGSRDIVIELLGMLINWQNKVELSETNWATELNVFNTICYKYFYNRLIHGRLVTSVMGFFQKNTTSWFTLR